MSKNLSVLKSVDPEVFQLLQKEEERQEDGLELIASENYASQAVMEAQGSVATNKYAEGYPGKRYYGGCEFIDGLEELARERLKKLFKASWVNVQPHSGSQANMAVFFSLLSPGDKIMGMDLSEGGHLTHGSAVNFSGKIYNVASYGIDRQTEKLNYEQIAEQAKKERPKLIIAGASAYSQKIDFAKFREIADSVGAFLLVDMAHIAGLVATGLHPSPLPYADAVTSTTHKTLRGPRGGIILSNNEELAKKFDSSIFPGIQGGPLEHVIAAKAIAFKEALSPDFLDYQRRVIANAKTLAKALSESGKLRIVSGGTENHLLLVDLTHTGRNGKEVEALLGSANITCNKNMIPGDQRSPFVTSGIRLGTPAVTSRGMDTNEMLLTAQWILKLIEADGNEIVEELRNEVRNLCRKFPVYSSS